MPAISTFCATNHANIPLHFRQSVELSDLWGIQNSYTKTWRMIGNVMDSIRLDPVSSWSLNKIVIFTTQAKSSLWWTDSRKK